MFTLHQQLAADTVALGTRPLCRVLLMKDRRFPWLVLVPQRPDIREIHQLSAVDRAVLIEEIADTAAAMEKLYQAHKMNVAALGNQVPQLHVHVIARFTADPAWPTPIWGQGTPAPYGEDELAATSARIRSALRL
ncbi:MAG: HIT family protein [Alphaproteobacteria bacterium]|nr:HIT family protein [Alphaproteobacteria bacterium]